MWVSFIKVWVEHVWLQGKKGSPGIPSPPQKTKRAGLRPVCVVMMRIESLGKMRSGATIGSRFLRMDLSGTCIQGGARDLWHVDIQGSALGDCPINVVGLFFCVYSSLSPCVWWRNPPPGEAGIGPDHHVMPGTDIGLGQPVDWLLWGWDPFPVQWVMVGEGEGRRKQAPRAQNVVPHASRSCKWVGLRNMPGTVCWNKLLFISLLHGFSQRLKLQHEFHWLESSGPHHKHQNIIFIVLLQTGCQDEKEIIILNLMQGLWRSMR